MEILQKLVLFAQPVITKDCSQQHRMQNNEQNCKRLELTCDINVNKKIGWKNWIKIDSYLFSSAPTQNIH